jgi:hypothetical protein
MTQSRSGKPHRSGENNKAAKRKNKKKMKRKIQLSAHAARSWFAQHGPPDAPSLPLSYEERESLKGGGLPHMVAWYARSLENLNYDYDGHPSFDDYARGVLASSMAPDFITSDQTLLDRYPPSPLRRLGPGLIWEPLPDLCKGAVPPTAADAGYAEWAPAFDSQPGFCRVGGLSE